MFQFGSDRVADLAQHLNARREEVAITIDDLGKLPVQGGGLFVGKFEVHASDIGWRLEDRQGRSCTPPGPGNAGSQERLDEIR
jgi:hypothetical protein